MTKQWYFDITAFFRLIKKIKTVVILKYKLFFLPCPNLYNDDRIYLIGIVILGRVILHTYGIHTVYIKHTYSIYRVVECGVWVVKISLLIVNLKI